jgi:hypothetical protein
MVSRYRLELDHKWRVPTQKPIDQGLLSTWTAAATMDLHVPQFYDVKHSPAAGDLPDSIYIDTKPGALLIGGLASVSTHQWRHPIFPPKRVASSIPP